MNISTQVPLFSAQSANEGLDFLTPIQRVLDRHWYVLGDEIKKFEDEFAAYVGVKHCIGVANGTDALELALRALHIEQGARVIVVANAGFYGSTAIHAVGADPMFIDVDDASLTMSPAAFAAILDSHPAAVIVTHLYGQMAEIARLVELAQEADVPVIEDCAQSHGARRNGKQAGTFGNMGCFSFYPTKNLGALGDGGAVVTDREELAESIRRLRQYGWSEKYHVSLTGGRNSRLDEMQAAILRTKLPHLDRWNAQRRAIAQRYNTAFAEYDMKLPPSMGEDYVAHLYVVRVRERNALSSALKKSHISTDVHYPIADHRQPAYKPSPATSLPVTEEACETVLSLPCFPNMSEADVGRVIDAFAQYFSARAA